MADMHAPGNAATPRFAVCLCLVLPCLQPAFVWEWYCTGKERGSALPSFIRALITGWLPSLLLNLWLTMVLPRLVYLIVQVSWVNHDCCNSARRSCNTIVRLLRM